jgi:hypothetical protein
MRVILYLPDGRANRTTSGDLATQALSVGLNKLGVDHTVTRPNRFDGEIADVAIVNGWHKDMLDRGGIKQNRNRVIEAQAAAGKPAWCIERGFIGDRKKNSAMSIDGFCSNGGDFRAEGMPSDRWDALGIELKPWRSGGDYILLCAQVPWDAQVQDGNHIQWLEDTADEIRKHTERPIRFRPHPKAYRRGRPYSELTNVFSKRLTADERTDYRQLVADLDTPPPTTFEEDLAGAHAVVCYNSNVATLSVIAGVPVFTGAPCLADPIACRDLSIIDDPRLSIHLTDMRQQWANDLAYKQWNIEDFREGRPWLHLTRP